MSKSAKISLFMICVFVIVYGQEVSTNQVNNAIRQAKENPKLIDKAKKALENDPDLINKIPSWKRDEVHDLLNKSTDNKQKLNASVNKRAIKDTTEDITNDEIEKEDNEDDFIKRKGTSKNKSKYFGYSIFSNIPDAFKPSQIGPVDPGYLISHGDVLRIVVWGEVEFQYEMSVSKEGKIYIPNVGQVYVSGMPFESIQKKAKNLLSRHYSGIAKDPPTIFMDLTIAELRPIKIFVMGEVKNPGGYTVSGYASVFNALYSIGGPKTSGSIREIIVYRNSKKIATIDIYEYLLKGNSENDIQLQNSDMIFIPPRKNSVTIQGNVFRPYIYELKDNENLLQLLKFAGDVKTTANIDRAQIKRLKPFTERNTISPDYEIIDFNLLDVIKDKKDIKLFDNDIISVFSVMEDYSNYITLAGNVKNPGLYAIENITLYDLIFKLGKILPGNTYMKRGDIIRFNEDNVTTSIIPFDIDILSQNPEYMNKLHPLDQIIVYNISVKEHLDKYVNIEGEIKKPGEYILRSNMTLEDLILSAGGFTKKTYTDKIEIYRHFRDKDNDTLITKKILVSVDTSNIYKKNNKINLLNDFDRVVVRKNPNFEDYKYVYIKGRVKFPGKYPLERRDERVSDIIKRAGGFTIDAFLEGAFLERNEKRVIINYANIINNHKSSDDIILFPDDHLTIPGKPNTVKIIGNVNVPGLYVYIPNFTINNYIDMSGELLDSTDYILLSEPSGETKKIDRRRKRRTIVKEGSVIDVKKMKYVPEKEDKDKPSVGEILKDIFAITASAVTVIVLIWKLNEK